MRVLFTAFFTLISASWVGSLPHAQVNAATQTPAAQTGWAWPAIPGCLSDPSISTPGSTDFSSPVCPLYDQLLTSGVTRIELVSARRLNGEMDGVLYPAFLPGTEVVTFLTEDKFNQSFHGATGLVRVSGKAVSARNGSWWTTLSTVTNNGKLLDAASIRQKLALPNEPSCLAYADNVRSGIIAYMGVVAPAFDQPGGGVEFWLPPGAVVAKKTVDLPGSSGCGTN